MAFKRVAFGKITSVKMTFEKNPSEKGDSAVKWILIFPNTFEKPFFSSWFSLFRNLFFRFSSLTLGFYRVWRLKMSLKKFGYAKILRIDLDQIPIIDENWWKNYAFWRKSEYYELFFGISWRKNNEDYSTWTDALVFPNYLVGYLNLPLLNNAVWKSPDRLLLYSSKLSVFLFRCPVLASDFSSH